MTHRLYAGTVYVLTICLATCVFIEHAMALDIRCVEGSQYKYLWQIFDNDRQKLAEFLQVPASRVPEPEMCRAVLITGTIGYLNKAGLTRKNLLSELDKLLAVIAQNDGWLATVYLASPGGEAVTGMFLGELTRLFWLKTRAVDGPVLKYFPDFATPDTKDGLAWQAYIKIMRQLPPVRLPVGQRRCASACELIHVGGIDRQGITYVHRVRVVTKVRTTLKILEILKTVEAHQLERVRAYLQRMDAGTDVIRKSGLTPPPLVNSAVTPRFPHEVSHLLASQCGAGIDELAMREDRIVAAIAKTTLKNHAAIDRLRKELARVRTSKVGICIAAAEEKGRLSRYSRYCSHRRCSREVVLTQVNRNFSVGIARSLAQDGHAWAQYKFGSIYANGAGVPQNFTEAAKWFRLAADKGYVAAQYTLGVMYQNGRGVPQNYVEAVKWYQLAAERGYAHAQYSLGGMFEFGRGVPQDYVLSYMWYSLAAASGDKLALINRNVVAEHMAVDQIAKAKTLTRDWKPKQQPSHQRGLSGSE